MRLRYYFFLVICIATINGCAVSRQSGQAEGDAQRVLFHSPEADRSFGYATIQTSVNTLTDSKGTGRVCLFSMLHIGERQYYEDLEPLLGQADIILYESMRDADSKGEGAEREVDVLKRNIMELYARLAGLEQQHSWQNPLMETDSRWKSIDLPKGQFYAYLDEHKINIKPSFLRDNLSKLRKLEQKEAGESAGVLRRGLLRDIMAMTSETCCYMWLPKKERWIVHEFIHTKRDANFLLQVAWVAREHPDSTIAVLLGARHVMPLKERLKAEHSFEEISIRWFDALKVHTRETAPSNEKDAGEGKH